MPYSTSLTSTLLFLSLFILAFFPNIFIALLKLPLIPFLVPAPTTPPLPPYTPHHNHCPCPCAGLPSPSPLPPPPSMSFSQKRFSLPARSRGAYLITAEVVHALPEIKDFRVGLVNLFVQHTSCALSLNENWDEDVRKDMSDALERIVPEETGRGRGKGKGLYRHDAEGADDMPVSAWCVCVVWERGKGVMISRGQCGLGGIPIPWKKQEPRILATLGNLPLTSPPPPFPQAHIKSALIGASVTVPITDGKLATGIWQGVWLLEFRDSKHTRNVVATIQGEKM